MIVMKFGGTSLEDAAAMANACEIVKSRVKRQPVVVLSAAAGITNALIRCAELAAEGRRVEAEVVLRDKIIDRHYRIIAEVIRGLSEQDTLIRQFKIFDEELRSLIYGISITGDLSPRVLDFVMSYGERMSSAILTEALREHALRAELLDARKCLVTNSNFGKAEPLFDATRTACASLLRPRVEKGVVPVLQGFIGANEQGVTTTLGRGGSDYSAAIIGTVLAAEDIEIWTDVDGMLTADPKIVPTALRIREMSFQEASELAYFGAKVLHPGTVLPAIEKNIPVHILNSRRPQLTGTLIRAQIEPANIAVKSISYKRGISILNISSTRMLGSYGFMKKIFDIFNEHQTAVDLVTTSEVSISLSIEHSPNLERLVEELRHHGEITVQRNKAIICIVGERLRSERGIAARVFSRLRDVPVDMISHGASEINLTCVIDEERVPEAVSELHEEFFSTIAEPGIFE
ncbi:MAG: lysine-sensitive aspartokinase 3 [Bacteroidota bacterium]|jgi:aspartate kinase|nr:lysine-sensitive aspartokinase 3 [Bacteroidota bacterium]